MNTSVLIPVEQIGQRILLVRGQRVMVDRDLAELYGVETKYLNRQVKRNRARFPKEFMFRLTARENVQLVTNWHRFEALKHSSALPYVFTEHGVAMLSSVLNSERAIRINILIIKAFMKLRDILRTHRELALKLKQLEMRLEKHDENIHTIFEAIRQLMRPPEPPPKRRIGFGVEEPKVAYRIARRGP